MLTGKLCFFKCRRQEISTWKSYASQPIYQQKWKTIVMKSTQNVLIKFSKLYRSTRTRIINLGPWKLIWGSQSAISSFNLLALLELLFLDISSLKSPPITISCEFLKTRNFNLEILCISTYLPTKVENDRYEEYSECIDQIF
jgi:hypothetical protein